MSDATNTIVLTTDRLTIRPTALGDLDAFAKKFANPAVMRYIGDGSTRSREQVETTIRNLIKHHPGRELGLFTAIDREGNIVGDGLLLPIPRSGTDKADYSARGPEIELGYRLDEPYWGMGYATEIAKALFAFATSDPRGPMLTELMAVTDVRNEASKRVLTKVGFKRKGDSAAFYNEETTVFSWPASYDPTAWFTG